MSHITAKKGKDMKVFIGSSFIAGSTECSIEIGADIVEIASPSSGAWKEYKAKRKSWSVATSHLLSTANESTLLGLIGTTVTLALKEYDGSSWSATETGSAICTKLQITAKNRDFITANASFQGTGALS